MNKQIMKDLRHTSLTLSYAYGAVFVVCMFAGCGPDNPLDRQAISGMVTFDGKPLPHGSISFEPSQSGGVTSGATVTNGQYDIVAHKGLPSGRYLVRINASMSDS